MSEEHGAGRPVCAEGPPVWRRLLDCPELDMAVDPTASTADAVRLARALDAAERADGLAGWGVL